MSARRARYLDQGLCSMCGKRPLVTKDRCKPCAVASVARQHGLAPEAYAALLEAGCRICGSKDRLHVDHDHACCADRGRKGCGTCVRGILCQPHNTLAGFLEHPDALAVAAYLASAGSTAPLFAAVRDGGVPDPLSQAARRATLAARPLTPGEMTGGQA